MQGSVSSTSVLVCECAPAVVGHRRKVPVCREGRTPAAVHIGPASKQQTFALSIAQRCGQAVWCKQGLQCMCIARRHLGLPHEARWLAGGTAYLSAIWLSTTSTMMSTPTALQRLVMSTKASSSPERLFTR